jgi:hypothetical protein
VGTLLAEQEEATQAQETQAAEETRAEESTSTSKQPKQRKRKRIEVGTLLAKQAEATQAQETQAAEASTSTRTSTSKQPKQRKRKRIEVGTSLAKQAEATQAQDQVLYKNHASVMSLLLCVQFMDSSFYKCKNHARICKKKSLDKNPALTFVCSNFEADQYNCYDSLKNRCMLFSRDNTD